MLWKKQLQQLEKIQKWDFAIDFMQETIAKNPADMDAYMAIHFLIMNILVEEKYDFKNKHNYYAGILKHYFDESYAKFCHNAEYLFYTSLTASMSLWYFDIEVENAKAMLNEALRLEPDNILYQETYYSCLDLAKPENKEKAFARAHMVLEENSPLKKILQAKGSLGGCIFGLMVVGAYRLIYQTSINEEEYAHYMQDFQ